MLKTRLVGFDLNTCIFNASGPNCTTLDELIELASCPDTSVTLTKSTTKEKRQGNPEPRYWESPNLTINSTGLANMGYEFYGQVAPVVKYVNITKPYAVSVAGLSHDDNLEMIKDLSFKQPIDWIELNLSCPNVIGKPQTGYDLEASETLLRKIYDNVTNPKPIGVKLPPYFDGVHITQMAELLQEFPIRFVTCINSLGNGLVVDTETECPVIRPKCGLGGIGGDVILPFALSNVFQFRNVLSERIDVVGCGGISSGEAAFQHILVGATAIQIGSSYMKEGIGCFERITRELQDIMTQKGYKTLDEFRGTLKEMD